jgi:D-3-phosphoglycerate dehydrogenase
LERDLNADILITEELVSPAVQRLAAKYRVVCEPDLWKDEAKLRASLGQARCVMMRNQTKLTRAVIASAPQLLAIGRVGVGLDNIDIPAANEFGIVIIAPLNANAVSVAELTIGLIISLARKIPEADRSTKAGQWDRRGCTGMELHGKTLALLGFGRIGRMVAARAGAFGLKVVAYDPFIKDAASVSQAGAILVSDLFEALAQADFVSAHLPLTDQTRRVMNTRAFAAMKAGAFFINTSRGGVVDEPALLNALQSGHIASAALDVREIEPPTGSNSFAAMEQVILTPHIASFTNEAQARTFEAVCADLDRALSGQPVENFVNFALPKK